MNLVQNLMQKALKAYQESNWVLARNLSLKILKKNKRDENATHLLALVYKQENNLTSAKKYFEQCLKINPNQAAVISNYANLLNVLELSTEANKAYSKSIRLDPSNSDAWYNWAILLNNQKKYSEAKEKINHAIELKPLEAKYFIVLGISLRALEDFESSIGAFTTAHELSSPKSNTQILALQNKAITYREMQNPTSALNCLNDLVKHNVESPELYFIKACSNYDLGELKQAEEDLLKAIEINPEYIEAHEALNKLYWEESEDDKFLNSYKNNISKYPLSRNLHYSYAAQLIMASQNEKAKLVLTEAIKTIGSDAGLLHALAILMMRSNEFTESVALLDKAIKMQPNVIRYRIDKANYYIKHHEYKKALVELDRAGKLDVLNQEVWAYKGLCWRLLGDSRAVWLNNYAQLVDSRYLDVPLGYDDLEHFMFELGQALSLLHKTNRQPLDQSVINGTQTVGRLLMNKEKVIQDYRTVLTKSIQDYLNELPVDDEHPFLNRNTRNFLHTGSWSVKLKSGGFHTNHMHPQGWLSNCTYVNVPQDINQYDRTQAGWLKLGESSLNLGERENIAKTICPKTGLRVLFPSYIWHGTIPFTSSNFRITLPSDIAPKIQ